MKLPLDWLREFAHPDADAAAVAKRMADCGFAVDAIAQDVIDFEITANRPDCLSIYGLAREVATAFDVKLADPKIAGSAGPIGPGSEDPKIAIEHEACARYAMALADVTVGPSPAWLADRLTACGVRPINNVVDATNYVMLELGHPMHAFDLAKLAGPEIHVRLARAGEALTTLDGEARTLQPSMLVIADRDRAVAVAGVMGGRASEVSTGTRRVTIESAWFQPASVRATAKRLGLKTEASARFERGADIDAPVTALGRVLGLLEEIGAGRRTGPWTDVYPSPAARRSVVVRRDRVTRLLGTEIPDADITRILGKLGFTLEPAAGGWRAGVPSFRVDVAREADLIEEIGRHWGFDRIPATFPAMQTPPEPSSDRVGAGRDVRRILAAQGLQEAVTFTFIEAEAAASFAPPGTAPATIANPLSEKFAVLRPSMLPGLVDACIYNLRRQETDVRLFEVGAAFPGTDDVFEAGWVLAGERKDHWSAPPRANDFFDATGIASSLASAFGLEVVMESAAGVPWGVPGRIARVRAAGAGGVDLGTVAQVRPAIVAARGGGSHVVVAGSVRLDPLVTARRSALAAVAPLPRFPSVVRDLSLLVDARLPAETVRGTIRANAPATLVDAGEFDRYQGKGIPDGQISLSVRLTFRDADRTLTDEEVQRAVEAVVAALAREHGIRLRA